MRVPFPHIERSVMVVRPALIVTPRPVGPGGLLSWTLMITNAARPDWPGDIPIPDVLAKGLLIPSKIRTAKISTSETASATMIGRLDEPTLRTVQAILRATFAFD